MFNNSAALTMPVVPANYGYGNGGGMFGGNSGDIWGLLILLALFGGWGNGGFGFGGNGGGAGFQGLATRADINEGFALNNITGGITAIQQGICDSTYALTNAINGGFHGVDNAICNLGYNVQSGFNSLSHQLSDCCCQTQRAIDGVNYNMAANTNAIQNALCANTRDIVENNNANTRAILDFLTNSKLEDLRAENQALKLSASQANQNATLMAAMDANKAEIIRRTGNDCPIPAYVVNGPTPINFPVNNCGTFAGYGNGCGC